MADLNDCSARKLANTAQIPSELADNIVTFRKQRGGIKNFDELVDVDGMTRTTMKKIKTFTKLGKLPQLKRAKNCVIEKKENNRKDKIKKESRKEKPSSGNKNSNLTPEVALPLLRMNQSGSSPVSRGQSPIRIYTPVKLEPSKSGSRITAEYHILSPVQPRKHHDSSTFSSHFSTKVNPPSYLVNKRSVKKQRDKHRKLPHNKEESIRSWLKGIQTDNVASANSSPIRNSCNRGKAKHSSKQKIDRPSSSKAKYHRLSSLDHRRPADKKQLGNWEPTGFSQKRRKRDAKNYSRKGNRPKTVDVNYRHKFENEHIAKPAKPVNMNIWVKRPRHTTHSELPDEHNLSQTFRDSPHVASASKPCNPVEERQLNGRRSSIKSYRELQTRSCDAEDDRTFICRSSIVRKKSITPTKALTDSSDFDISNVSSDVSLIKRDEHRRKRGYARSHKRRRQSRERERRRQRDLPRDEDNDDHKQACIII